MGCTRTSVTGGLCTTDTTGSPCEQNACGMVSRALVVEAYSNVPVLQSSDPRLGWCIGRRFSAKTNTCIVERGCGIGIYICIIKIQ